MHVTKEQVMDRIIEGYTESFLRPFCLCWRVHYVVRSPKAGPLPQGSSRSISTSPPQQPCRFLSSHAMIRRITEHRPTVSIPRSSQRTPGSAHWSTSARPDVALVRLGIDWWGSVGIGPTNAYPHANIYGLTFARSTNTTIRSRRRCCRRHESDIVQLM